MYDELSNAELSSRVAALLDMSPELALKAVESDDPELGRAWAIAVLEARDRHDARQDRITEHRENIRRFAGV